MKSKVVAIKKCIECPNSYYRYGIEGNVNTGVPWCSLIDTELTERQTKIHDKCTLPNSESPSTPVVGREQLREKISNAFDENSSDANNGQMSVITEDSYSDLIDEILELFESSHPVSRATDEDIENWADDMTEELQERSLPSEKIRMIKRNRIYGAKAMQDGLIPISQNTNDEKK